jgi:hypothetical protein
MRELPPTAMLRAFEVATRHPTFTAAAEEPTPLAGNAMTSVLLIEDDNRLAQMIVPWLAQYEFLHR